MKNMKLEHRVLGAVSTNVYLMINTDRSEAVLIDPADRPGYITKWINEAGVTLKAILLTHGHFDHIGAVNGLKKEFQVPVYAMAAEKAILNDPVLNLSGGWAEAFSVKSDVELKDEEELDLAGFRIIAYHTPGHTKGGACYYFPEEEILFSGDTLFCRSVGRTDFPTGSMGEIVRSIRRLTEVIPEDTRVYPGHEASTTIAEEKMFNPYL